MNVITITKQISISKWKNDGGGVSSSRLIEAENMLNAELGRLNGAGCEIIDVKVNHFTANRHNNGGYDEVWVQYTILYR